MDKDLILSELFHAMKILQDEQNGDNHNDFVISCIWTSVKEICGIKAEGRFSNKILEYVLELLDSSELPQEEPYKNLILYLTNSKIEMNEDY